MMEHPKGADIIARFAALVDEMMVRSHSVSNYKMNIVPEAPPNIF
jgi:hypothetical protein